MKKPFSSTALPADTRVAVLTDWRQMSYVECGASAGAPLLFFHDAPGSRMQRHPDRGIAQRLGMRVIHLERPGYGMTSTKSKNSLRGWAADIADFADRAEIQSFSIAATGAGAPYALACAALLPQRVRRVALAASYVEAALLEQHTERRLRIKLWLARQAPSLLRIVLQKNARRAARDPDLYVDRLLRRLPASDASVLREPAVRARTMRDLPEAYRQRTQGLRLDLDVLARPWNLPLDTIACPVALWHGSADPIVPLVAAEALAQTLPRAILHRVEGGGHWLWYREWPAMLAWIATDSPAAEQIG
jgi:pimeloyl-ACP methyl ester carboxylesterase